MSAPHSIVLAQLIPLELGETAAADLALEGARLDAVSDRAEEMQLEAFPDTAAELLTSWERIFAIAPLADATLQSRRNAVVRKLREIGGMTAAYYTALAELMGYTITIDEPFATEGPHAWRITFSGFPVYEFLADESCAEELLLDWDEDTAVEGLFQDLKPAHSRLIIAYA